MQLIKYNPYENLRKIERDIESLWENGWGSYRGLYDISNLDLYEEDGKLIAEVNLPNYKKEEVKVVMNEDILEISAEHKDEENQKNKRHYYFRESSNHYFRRINLPEGAQTDRAIAFFNDGILRVVIPMLVSSRVNEIEIR